MTFRPSKREGRDQPADRLRSLERGEKQTAVGTGFKPGESVTGVMTSEPIALGTKVADAQGTVTFTWTIPSGTDLGTHAVTLTGATSGSVSASFQVCLLYTSPSPRDS